MNSCWHAEHFRHFQREWIQFSKRDPAYWSDLVTEYNLILSEVTE